MLYSFVMNKFNPNLTRIHPILCTNVLINLFSPQTNWCARKCLLGWWPFGQTSRSMTTSKRVQDRSSLKRVLDLEIATEKWKIASKVLYLIEILKKEPEMIIQVRNLEQYRKQINLPKPNKISDFLRKSPKLFELYKDQRGVLWCGMTKEGEELVEEEDKILRHHADKVAEHVTRFLMMSVDKRLALDKIAHFRRDFGLPNDFRTKWVHEYPQYFKVVKCEDENEYLELVSWIHSWAITELEKKAMGVKESPADYTPGLLSLPFPLKFPANYKKVYRYGGKIEHFQKRSYLSPYAAPHGLEPGSKEFDKRAVAVMHELLNFTIEKRLVTDHLTHFRRELVMPQKLMRIFLKHCGIFYVSERGKRFSVFLTEAYDGSELIEKCPLILWKEKVQSMIGYRGKKKKIETFSGVLEMEEEHSSSLVEDDTDGDLEKETIDVRDEEEDDDVVDFEDDLVANNAEMEIGEIDSMYKDSRPS